MEIHIYHLICVLWFFFNITHTHICKQVIFFVSLFLTCMALILIDLILVSAQWLKGFPPLMVTQTITHVHYNMKTICVLN